MTTLGLKEMGKFLWEGGEKSLPSWLSQFSSQRNFSISFKPKVAIAEFFWRMQRKTWYSILRVDAMPLFLKNLLLKIRQPILPDNAMHKMSKTAPTAVKEAINIVSSDSLGSIFVIVVEF